MRSWMLLPMLAATLTGCGIINQMNRLVNESTYAIHCNRLAVEMSTEAVCRNIQAIEAANEAIDENRERLMEINDAMEEMDN